jgi:serine/threonine-protein kinase
MNGEIVYAQVDAPREFARLLRAAMRYAVAWIPFDIPPEPGSQYFVVLELKDTEHTVTVQGELAGSPRGEQYPVRLRPMSATQSAQLFVLCESIDVPSDSIPPPSTRFGAEAPSSKSIGRSLPLTGMGTPTTPSFDFAEPTRIDRVPDDDVPPSSSSPSSRRGSKPRPVSIVPPAAASGDPVLGRVLAGKYRMESIVGTGSFGAVYRATHIDLQRTVAIKMLHGHTRADSKLVERFRREAIAAGRIDHVNVTRVLDFGQEERENITFIVMEFVPGESLERLVSTAGRLPPRRVLEIGIQVASALASAHAHGVVHRDIKPENVMLVANPDADEDDPHDLVKVCDFGTAKLRDPPGSELTMGGMLCGSPAYMSPEQASGRVIDHRSDLYGLGVTLFEALTGRLPLEAQGVAELLMAITTMSPRRPSDYVSGIPPAFEALILKLLEKNPAHRPASARALRAELRRLRSKLMPLQ